MEKYNININFQKVQEQVQKFNSNTIELNFGRFGYLCMIFLFFFTILINSCDFNTPVTNFGTKVKSEVIWNLDIETLEKLNIISEKFFDNNGKIIKVVNYGVDGDKINESSFIYNNNESKETKITFNSDGNQSIQDFSYTYNELGRIEQKVLVSSNDTTNKHITDYTYDELGNIIKIIETNFVKSLEVKSIESKLIYNYSQNGSISEIIYNNQNPENNILRDSLVYNKTNNSLKMYQIDKQNTVVSAVLYNYNSLGHIILTSFFDKNLNIFMKQSHIYTYQ